MVFFEPGRADVQPRAEQGLQRSGVLDALLRTGGVGGAADGLIAGGKYCSTGASAALAGAVSPAWAAVGQLNQRYFRATVSAL